MNSKIIILVIVLIIGGFSVLWFTRAPAAQRDLQSVLDKGESLVADYEDKITSAQTTCDYSGLQSDTDLATRQEEFNQGVNDWINEYVEESLRTGVTAPAFPATSDQTAYPASNLDQLVKKAVNEETNTRWLDLQSNAIVTSFFMRSYEELAAECSGDTVTPTDTGETGDDQDTDAAETPATPIPDPEQPAGDDLVDQVPGETGSDNSSSNSSQDSGSDPGDQDATPSLPDNWDELSPQAKIVLNPLGCDLETEIMWAEDGTCHPINPNQTDGTVSNINDGSATTPPSGDLSLCTSSGPQVSFNIVTDPVNLPSFTHGGATEIAGERATLTLIKDGHRVSVQQIREDAEVLGEFMQLLDSVDYEDETFGAISMKIGWRVSDGENELIYLIPIGGYCFAGVVDNQPGNNVQSSQAELRSTLTTLITEVTTAVISNPSVVNP